MAQLPDPLAGIPSIDINVDAPTAESYGNVMDWILNRDLQRAANIDKDRFRNIPITSADPGWRRINLVYQGHRGVSLLIDEINGYLTAISRDDGVWMKFDDLNTFPGLPNDVEWVNLGIKSSYLELVQEEESLELTIGKHILANGYHVLRHYDATLSPKSRRWRNQRRALAQLIIMFCEAARFIKILHLIIEVMGTEESKPLPFHMWNWMKNWSSLSAFALYCKKRGDAQELEERILKTVEVYGIHNRTDIAAILRLILRRY